MIAALLERRIGGAGLDVYWQEPLAAGHPLVGLDNVVLTPHLGYVVEESFKPFYEDSVENIAAWLDRAPIRALNPQALTAARSGSAPRAGPL